MRLPRLAALLFALAASPALAIDSAPDESAEDDRESDSYIPNRFSINLHGEWAHFNQHRDVGDTGGGGLRIGWRVNRWAELQLGAAVYQTNLPAHGVDNSIVDFGLLRFYEFHLDLRIDVTDIDPVIPWPFTWCRPLVIGGLGFSVLDLHERATDVVELNYRRAGVVVRGGAGVEFGPADARAAFGLEWIYNWVGNDIRVNDPTANFPSHLHLHFWTLGAYVTLRF